jgi:hypothetical protein
MERFQSSICGACRICDGVEDENFNPEFCFEKFEEAAAVFVEDVYPRLLLVGANLGKDGLEEKDLLYAVCDTGVCFLGDSRIANECNKTNKCLKKFQAQAKQMSKKKHKQKPPKVYSKKQFSNFICGQCQICPYYTEPEFCFEEVYKHNPKGFMEKVYPHLLDIKRTYRDSAKHVSMMTKEEFKKKICGACACFDNRKDCEDCCDSSDCFDTFMDSTTGLHIAVTTKEKKNKKKNKYVPVPYATFFSSSKKGFQEEIQKILYGNNNSKQNKNKEVPEKLIAEVDSRSSDGEPEISRGAKAGA